MFGEIVGKKSLPGRMEQKINIPFPFGSGAGVGLYAVVRRKINMVR